MYAVIEVQGSQFRVEKNDKITVNRIKDQKSKDLKVDKVLFGKKGNSYFVGEPYVKDAYVDCEIIGDKRAKKVIVFKYRDRKSSQSKKGHRQDQTEVKIKDIYFTDKAEAKKETKKEEKPAEKAEEKKPLEKAGKKEEK